MENFNVKAINKKVRENLPFSHRWHNRFHLEMPFGLINDPNGLAFYDGEYHIFYQWNPLGTVHKNKCWGHTATRDFVNYRMPELAMHPTDEHDKDGCYSGCGFTENGSLNILYTCNAKDENGVRTPAQRLGTFAGSMIKKEEIVVPTNAAGYTAHFRDPYVFWRHKQKHFVLGAQTEDERGCVVVYREGENGWEFLGELKTKMSETAEKFGYMWECPALVRFGNYDVLFCCPQGLPAKDYKYQNAHQAGYFAGHASLDSMEMYHGRFQELDRGFDFYAPQVFAHGGRRIMLGWMGMPDRDVDYPTAEKGWVFSLTMPRVLTLRQGHIFAKPAKELRALRIEESAVDIDAQETQNISVPLGEGAEVLLDVEFGKAQQIDIELIYGFEKTVMSYDRRTQVMTIDRTGMKLGGRGVRKFKIYADETLALNLFVDRTAIEAFFEYGEEVASFFVFPEKNILPELVIKGDAPISSVSGRIWDMDAIKFS